MPVTPSGILSLNIEALASLVAASATFQSWVNLSNSGQAVDDHIYRIAVLGEPPTGFVRPFAMIVIPKGSPVARGGYIKGELSLMFERAVPFEFQEASLHRDAGLDFLNGLGAICSEIVRGAEGSGTLFIPDGGFTIESAQRSYLPDDDYFQAMCSVVTGTR